MPNANAFPSAQDGLFIEVAGLDLVFKPIHLADRTPTGAQIASAAGYSDAQAVTVFHLLPNGELEDVRPTEVAGVADSGGRFIVAVTDRSYRLTIDGKRIDWPTQRISGSILRHLGGVQANKLLYLERQDKADVVVEDHDLVDLGHAGVETFYSRAPVWILNIQGVRLEVATPKIVVSEAMRQAGFDTNQGWHIFLKVAGQPKQALELTSVVDLRAPGIEKIP